MTNAYYNLTVPTPFTPGTKVRSDEVVTEYNLVAAGFDLLPASPTTITKGRVGYAGVSTGAGNVYTTLTGDSRAADEAGDVIIWKADKTNTGAATLQVDSHGARALVDAGGVAMAAGDILIGSIYEARYDLANTRWQLVSPTAFSAAIAKEWAVNPYLVAVTGFPGQYSALSWATAAAASAAAAAASAAAAAVFDPSFYVTMAGAQTITGTKTFRADQIQDRYSADAVGNTITIQKSRNATPGSQTIMLGAEPVSSFLFQGSNGVSFNTVASIVAATDNQSVLSATNMPGRLSFSTVNDGTLLVRERLRINSLGNFIVTGGNSAYFDPYWGGANTVFIQQKAGASLLTTIEHYNNVGSSPLEIVNVSAAATLGTQTAVANGAVLGEKQWRGSDGTGFIAAAGIEVQGDGAVALNSMPGRMLFKTTPAAGVTPLERFRITSAPQVIATGGGMTYGDPPSVGGTIPTFIVQGAGGSSWVSQDGYSADTVAPVHAFRKSRSAAIPNRAVVVNGDNLGTVQFWGADGANYQLAAAIRADVDGIPGASDMPGRLVFSTTADGAAALTERIRIDNAGLITINVGDGAFAVPAVRAGGNITTRIESNVVGTPPHLGLIGNTGANTAGPILSFSKSNGAAMGATTVAQTSSILGQIDFLGADGNDYELGARLHVVVEGSPAINSMGAQMIFSTTRSGLKTLREAMRINANGSVVVTAGTEGIAYVTPLTFSSTIPNLTLQSPDARGMANIRQSADTGGPILYFGKSRNVNYGTNAVVVSGDNLGTLDFRGSDGTAQIAAASIMAVSDGTPGANDMPGRLVFSTTLDGAATATERVRINNVGATHFSNASYVDPQLGAGSNQAVVAIQVTAAAQPKHHISLIGNSADADGGIMNMMKSRGTVLGSQTVVASADELGRVVFYGADGTGMVTAAKISAFVDGTPGASDMPGRLVFFTTADGASTLSERVRINNVGATHFSNFTYATPQLSSGSNQAMVVIQSTIDAQPLHHLQIVANRADTGGGVVSIMKSRGTVLGSQTTVANGDQLGRIQFMGADGTGMILAAQIACAVDSVVGTNDMPGNLSFSTTPDGTAALVERLKISNAGAITGWDAIALSSVRTASNAFPHQYNFVKSADTSRNTTTTFADDAHLVSTTIEGAYTYAFEICMYITCASAVPDFKWGINNTAETVCKWTELIQQGTVTSGGVAPTGDTGGGNSGSDVLMDGASDYMVIVKGFISWSSAGSKTFKLQWAQNTSDATAVVLKQGSYMFLERMGPA